MNANFTIEFHVHTTWDRAGASQLPPDTVRVCASIVGRNGVQFDCDMLCLVHDLAGMLQRVASLGVARAIEAGFAVPLDRTGAKCELGEGQ